MIYTSPITTIGSAPVVINNPRDFTRYIDHAVVYNPGEDVAYLSIWRSAALDRVGTYAIGAGQTVTLPLGLHMGSDNATLGANANTDATGDPSEDLEITLGWSA